MAKPETANAAYWSQCIPKLSNPFLSKSELLKSFFCFIIKIFFKNGEFVLKDRFISFLILDLLIA